MVTWIIVLHSQRSTWIWAAYGKEARVVMGSLSKEKTEQNNNHPKTKQTHIEPEVCSSGLRSLQ